MNDNEKKKSNPRTADAASLRMLAKAESEGIGTCFSRFDTQQNQCVHGKSGVCCRICYMGPCRITAKSPFGICGANADTVVSRNFLREVCGGTAAHADHGRHLLLNLKHVSEGKSGDYAVKDGSALTRCARAYNIDGTKSDGASTAASLLDILFQEYTSQTEALKTIRLAPLRRQALWERTNTIPLGIDRMVVESLHRTHIGVDHDYKHILLQAFRTALADGWGGSRIASMVSDILFGTPMPVASAANLGILKENTVNILVHGHEPALSEMLCIAAADPRIVEYSHAAGAAGITLAGICCTANEILMRHGIPVAGNFLQQELALVTGAVEMMIIDVQCCMPSLPEVAKSFHTMIVSTSDIAKTEGAQHISFHFDGALETAAAIVKKAIDNFKRRDPAKVSIPASQSPLVAGFSVPAIKYILGGTFRPSFRPLNDAIIQGRIRGIAGIVGCNNPKTEADAYHVALTRELIRNDILVLKTGCAAIASAKQGLLTPESALSCAGESLREVCEAVGIPPVLHMGSCVDNSRILEAATELVLEGGLGDDLSHLPAVGVAPEWMSEKAVAIAAYFVASGITVILGHPFRISGSKKVERFLYEETAGLFGATFLCCPDPASAAQRIRSIIEEKREKLGINAKRERKLFDMKDRREINV